MGGDKEWRKDDWRGREQWRVREQSERERESASGVGVVASPLDCY